MKVRIIESGRLYHRGRGRSDIIFIFRKFGQVVTVPDDIGQQMIAGDMAVRTSSPVDERGNIEQFIQMARAV